MPEAIGYEADICWFCKGNEAGFRRGEDLNPKMDHDACQDCARKPYPQPKQFQEEAA
jgi:hypothetical protein